MIKNIYNKIMEKVVSTYAWYVGYLTGYFRGWERALGSRDCCDDTDPEIYMDHCHGGD